MALSTPLTNVTDVPAVVETGPPPDAGAAAELLLHRADRAIDALRGLHDADDVAEARVLLVPLRDARDWTRLLRLVELLLREAPADATVRRLQGQALIETGVATGAARLMTALAAELADTDPERAEALGLAGRAWKQIFFDAVDKASPAAQAALAAAVAGYRAPFEADRRRTWQGVNLLALEHRARRLGVQAAPDLPLKPLARELIETLQRGDHPAGPGDSSDSSGSGAARAARDPWWLPTLAQAAIALGDWDTVEARLKACVADAEVPAFLVAGTLRQLTEVWDVASLDPRGAGLVELLQARLLQRPGAEMRLSAAQVSRPSEAPAAGGAQLEAVLGPSGPQTYEWWLTGLARARSVASIKRRLASRIGTGFLVRAGDLGLEPADERLLVTNYHVVNAEGASPGVRPDEAQVTFEAADGRPSFDVAAIVWSAPPGAQDASVLRLSPTPLGIEPLPLAPNLPPWPTPAGGTGPRVYVVGHPGGRDLSFSFQDNELLGHEGPPGGKPPVPGVCRVHYRAPTEGGSSGSPVFDDRGWQLIALHHMGGELGMPHLNGEPGSYAANEGIALRCIVEAIAGAEGGGIARSRSP